MQRQAPLDSFQAPSGPWPNPRSPWPSWHGVETVYVPDPTHARQWQPPSSLVLQPGERKEYALRLALADGGVAVVLETMGTATGNASRGSHRWQVEHA